MTSIQTVGAGGTDERSVDIVSCTVCGTPFSASSVEGATRRAVVHLIDHRPPAAQR